MSGRLLDRGVGRAWADLPLRAKGLVVVAVPLLAMLLATVLFGVALAQDRRAQGAVLQTVEVERQIAQVRVLAQAGVQLSVLVKDNPGQVDRLERVRALVDQRADILAALVANVRAGRPAATRVELLDRNKETADALIAQLEAMHGEECAPSSAWTWPPSTIPTSSCSTSTSPTCPARPSCAASGPAPSPPTSR